MIDKITTDKELRLGNIVRLNNEAIVKLTNIYNDGHPKEYVAKEVRYGNEYLTEIGFIYPIKLTQGLKEALNIETDIEYLHIYQNYYEDTYHKKFDIPENILNNLRKFVWPKKY